MSPRKARRLVRSWDTDLREAVAAGAAPPTFEQQVRSIARRRTRRERLVAWSRAKDWGNIIFGLLCAAGCVVLVGGLFLLAGVDSQPEHPAACKHEHEMIAALDDTLLAKNKQFAAKPTTKLADIISSIEERRDAIDLRTWDDC